MKTLTTSILWAFALAAVWPAGARGASFDPALTWRTVESEHFAVHYHDGAYNLAVRVARIAEDVHDEVAALFGHMPEGQVDIVLVDNQDDANGSATTQPKSTLRLYLAAPTELTGLSYYEDWLRVLLIHEIAHLCDIDQANGFAAILAAVFGNAVSWNGYTPQFLSEGVAVYAETVLTGAGRGRSSYVAMLARTAALEGKFIGIDQANLMNSEWPGGSSAYFYGALFHLWLRDKYGHEAVRALHYWNAWWPWPFMYWSSAQIVFGKSLSELWDEWRADEEAFAKELHEMVKREGETASTRITFHGRNLTGARYSPDGSYIIYSRSSPVDGATVRRVDRDGENDEFLLLDTYSSRFSFAPDGKSFYVSQSAINNRFNDFNDLYRYELEGDKMVRLRARDDRKKSLRARDPDVAPDGERLVFVQNALHQSWVSVGTVVGDERDELVVKTLIPPAGDTQHASPRFSPDGSLVAVSTWFEGGKRDIILVSSDSGALVRRVTYDNAMDGNPAFSPDGRYVLYESDADGISNIYAYDLEKDAYYRVTRVIGGAFQPDVSRDGKWLLFRNASAIGFDIHEMPFAPSTWQRLHYDPVAGYQKPRDALGEVVVASAAPDAVTAGSFASAAWALAPLPVAAPRHEEPPAPLGDDLVDRPYSPWGSLLPFQENWAMYPLVYTLNGELTGALSTFGSDALRHHSYGATLGTSLYTRQPNWSAAYTYNAWYPAFTVAGGDLHVSYPSGDGERVGERRRSVRLTVDWPMLERHHVGVTYALRQDTPLDRRSRFYLGERDAAFVEAGYGYSRVRSFPYSVSAEHGGGVGASVRYYSEALGSDFDELLVRVDGRLYVNNPLFDNHVLVLRTTGAFALGPEYGQRLFLGGSNGSSVVTVQTDDLYSLRGFPLDLSRYPPRTGLAAAYAEYRFPITHIERGLWTMPIWFERFHGSLFADAGTTFGQGSERDATEVLERAWNRGQGGRVGVGAEVRLDLVLGWFAPLTVTGGVGFPVIEFGRPTGDRAWEEALPYVTLGTSL